MTVAHRALPLEPVVDLDDYIQQKGGEGLSAAKAADADTVIAEITASGLRGRGGGGFATGVKWRTVKDNRSEVIPTTVVVNGAEGEPGTFKDRSILRLDPYAVLEGALIAAHVVGADRIVVALKASFGLELDRIASAIKELESAGWSDGVDITVFEGPDEYLYGEETALLETIDGRYPFPRLAPPYRRGVDEVVDHADGLDTGSSSAAHVEMAGDESATVAPPTLVNNVETLANIPRIVARGADWFRTEGTEKSPGTVVCTITGSVVNAGVGEVTMGTTLREAIDEIGGGPRPGSAIKAVLPGVANALIPADQLDTPLTYEDMEAIGAGLGSVGFMVFDDSDDLLAVAAGVSRFLAIESCGQCTPCKEDGLFISGLLADASRSNTNSPGRDQIANHLATITEGARCYLATQHEIVVRSLLEKFPDELDRHLDGSAVGVEPVLIAELVDIVDGQAVIDERHAQKQPDWTYNERDSGQSPAARLGEHRDPQDLPDGQTD